MAVIQAAMARRSVGKMKPDAIPRDLVEHVLLAAVQAPNHYQNFPWRFWVVAGEAREKLGEVMAEALREGLPEPDSTAGQAALEAERRKPLRAPVIIVVGVDQEPTGKALPIENIEAAAAAVQNMLLAAHSLGLAAMWRTGKPAYSDTVKAHFGLGPEDHIVGFVYLGYPASEPAPRERSYEQWVEWRGWPEDARPVEAGSGAETDRLDNLPPTG